MNLDDLSRQLECALYAQMYSKARQIIEQIKTNEDYLDLDNPSINTLIIRKEVEEAERQLVGH